MIALYFLKDPFLGVWSCKKNEWNLRSNGMLVSDVPFCCIL